MLTRCKKNFFMFLIFDFLTEFKIKKNLEGYAAEFPMISFVSLHPKKVATKMTEGEGRSPKKVVDKMIPFIMSVDKGMSGEFFDLEGKKLPW